MKLSENEQRALDAIDELENTGTGPWRTYVIRNQANSVEGWAGHGSDGGTTQTLLSLYRKNLIWRVLPIFSLSDGTEFDGAPLWSMGPDGWEHTTRTREFRAEQEARRDA